MRQDLRWCAALFLVAPLPLHAQLAADSVAAIDQLFTSLNRADGPGCSVGIDRNGAPIFRRGYGLASIESGVTMTEHSVIETGSVAKQFTAGAIVLLAVQGRIGLDDPIRKFLPELHDFGVPVTIRMALNHTSGVRDVWILLWLAGVEQGQRLITMDQALAMIYRQQELNFPPDSAYLYSNSGYLLLAEVVKRVSGKSLARFSREAFFGPLGMTHTQWRDDWNRVVPGRVTAYARGETGELRVEVPYMNVHGSGGLLTTVGDLLRWNEELTHPTIGGPAWADLMHRRGRLTDGKDIAYASGVIVGQYRGETHVFHSGASGGYETFLGRWPARQLSVAVMCNFAGTSATTLARRVADVFIGPNGSSTPPTPATAPADTVSGSGRVPTSELAGLLGTYYSEELDQAFRLTGDGGRLTVHFAARTPITLRRVNRDEFAATPMNLNFKFARGRNGVVTGYLLSARRIQNLRFVRRSGTPRRAG